jgi:hypothetical protein
VVIPEGKAHGPDLFNTSQALAQEIADWLAGQLK